MSKRVIVVLVVFALTGLACSQRTDLVVERAEPAGAGATEATETDVPPEASAPTSSSTSVPAPSTTTTVPALVVPAPATSADELAERVTVAEAIARDPNRPTAEVAAAAFDAQLLYRQLHRRPEWRADVLAAVEERWRSTIAANVDGAGIP